MNKQSRTADKGWSCSLGVCEVLTTAQRKNVYCYESFTKKASDPLGRPRRRYKSTHFLNYKEVLSGLGGLGVACWPLVPKYAGSNPAEAVGFLGAKKSSARLPSEGK